MNVCSGPCVGEGCGDGIAIAPGVPGAKISSTGLASEDTG